MHNVSTSAVIEQIMGPNTVFSRIIVATAVCLSFLSDPTHQASFIRHHCTNRAQSHTTIDQSNLSSLLLKLASYSPITKFHSSSIGSGREKLFALFDCHDSFPSQVCHSCVTEAARSVQQHCMGRDEAIVWYEECTLRYSALQNWSVSSKEDACSRTTPWAWWYSDDTVKDDNEFSHERFNQTLGYLLEGLIDEVTDFENSAQFFGVKEVFMTIYETLYGIVKCSHGLSSFGCKKCLITAFRRSKDCCGGSRWATVFLPCCMLRYELSPNFFPTAASRGPFSSSVPSASLNHLQCPLPLRSCGHRKLSLLAVNY